MACVRILIADDHELVRQGVRALLASRPAWEVCGEAADGVEAIEKAAQLRPDIVLLDVSMPRLSGLEAAPAIRRESPASEILIVSQHDPADMLPSALQAGACAFVCKSDIGSTLLSTIESIIGPRAGLERRPGRPAPAAAVTPAPAARERQQPVPPRHRTDSLLLEQNNLLELIARGRPLDHCLAAITDSITRLHPDMRAAVTLASAGCTRIERIISARLPPLLTAQLRELPFDDDSVPAPRDAVLLRGEAVTVADIAADTRWGARWRKLWTAHGVQALHATPVRNAEGTITAAFFVCLAEARQPSPWERDLAQFGAHLASLAIERSRVEDRLRERSAQFETLIDQAPIGIFLLDDKLRLRHVNPAGRPGFASTPDLLGRDYGTVLHELRNRQYADHVLRIFRRTLESGESHHAVEPAIPRHDGAEAEYYEWRVDRIPMPGGRYGLVCYFRDVSVEMQARAALRQARDQLQSHVRQRTEELEQAYKSLRVLSMRMMQIQDEDRRRISRDLHDSAGQLLAALGMELTSLVRRATALSPELAQDIGGSLQLVQQLTQEIRTASYLLHPPLLDEAGLTGALRWYVMGLAKRSGIAITLQLDETLGRLPRDLEAAVFHIVQESLTNIHRHSGSKTAVLRIDRSAGRLRLEIEDTGSGISAEKLREIQMQGTGVGIAGMRERVLHFKGDMRITSMSPGTRIAVTFPIEPANDEPEPMMQSS
jgi:PAS domain S-box-containing protein